MVTRLKLLGPDLSESLDRLSRMARSLQHWLCAIPKQVLDRCDFQAAAGSFVEKPSIASASPFNIFRR